MKAGAALLAALLSLPASAGQATGHFGVSLTVLPPATSGHVTFRGRVLPDGTIEAVHPQCVIAGGTLHVRGEIFDLDADRPAAGVRVVVRNGPRYLVGITDAQGRYVITAPQTDAMTVTVVQAARHGPDGQRPVDAPLGRAACTAM